MAKPVPQDTDDLNAWFPRDNDQYANAQEQAEEVFAEKTRRLGVVVGGSLTKGLDVKLDRETEIEDLAVGRYVVVRGKQKRFFCMVTDVVLDSTNPLSAATRRTYPIRSCATFIWEPQPSARCI